MYTFVLACTYRLWSVILGRVGGWSGTSSGILSPDDCTGLRYSGHCFVSFFFFSSLFVVKEGYKIVYCHIAR